MNILVTALFTHCPSVYTVLVYEWVQTVLMTQNAFEINVYRYGDRTALTAYLNSWFSVTIMCAVISAVVQGYFCWRIYVLSRSKLMSGIIITVSRLLTDVCAATD